MNRQANITVDAKQITGPLDHYWRWIGYDECNYSYIPEGKLLLKKFAALEKDPYYVRTHFMFCTGNCHGTYKFGSTNIYIEDENGVPSYDFTYYDMILDAQLESGNKPFVELGFMPMDLMDPSYMEGADKLDDWNRHGKYKDTGWSCPPKDYNKWHDLILAVASHLAERYGEEEVKTWYFELWNEPDIFYWSGTAEDYCKLFDYTEHAFHTALPSVRLSGPAVTGVFAGNNSSKFFPLFLDHCREGVNYCTGEIGTRLDFITFHVKGAGFPFKVNAAKEVPSVESLVHQVKMGLDIICRCGYQDKEVVLSEADPDGWAAGGCFDNPNMIFRNTEYYASYVASTYEKIERLGQQYGMVVRPLAWAFMFPGERCFEGTRTFSTQGIDKAVFNMFKIFGKLGWEKLAFESDLAGSMDYLKTDVNPAPTASGYTGEGELAEVNGFAVKGEQGETQIVVFAHNNDRDAREEIAVTLKVSGLEAAQCTLEHYRIDAEHSNPYAEWIRQGKPLFPEGEQYDAIKAKDSLEKLCEDQTVAAADGSASISFTMPAHGVSLLILK